MKVDWNKVMVSVPQIIGFTMSAVEKMKGAKTGKEKEAVVIQTVKEGLPVVEGVAGKDLVNDPALDVLLSNYIAARVALANFLVKPPTVPEGVITPAP